MAMELDSKVKAKKAAYEGQLREEKEFFLSLFQACFQLENLILADP